MQCITNHVDIPLERHRMSVPDLEADFDHAVNWVEVGQGSRVIEIEGDNGEQVYMISPRLVEWIEKRIADLSQGLP